MSKSLDQQFAERGSFRTKQHGFFQFFTGLAIGLFVAFIVYLQSQTGLNKPDADSQQSTDLATLSGQNSKENSAAPDNKKPKYDFYTILPETEVKVPEWEVEPRSEPDKKPNQNPPTQKKPTTVTSVEKAKPSGKYILQVGSYQKLAQAEAVKAKLALLGLSSSVGNVTINGNQMMYRVNIGPITDPAKLKSIRARLTENKVDYLLIQSKAN